MIKKLILGGLLVSGATLGPVAYFGAPDYWKSATGRWFPTEPADGATSAATAAGESTPDESPRAAGETAMLSMTEAFRFDVTTGWILQRWPLASIGLADPRMQGYRVPLVTGTAQTDLAGALTYYFNSQQKLQRITFEGTTGDARELIQLMASKYRFTRRIVRDAGQYRYEAAQPDGKTKSTLEVHAAQMVNANDPFGRFEVNLTLLAPS
ncbi:MAG: hypothetical protein HQ567_09580 [Candidatus Nealsonbacteria bacterium]|nr:hypothetical protein [Candidatus Nealsonbacteria bacterium]